MKSSVFNSIFVHIHSNEYQAQEFQMKSDEITYTESWRKKNIKHNCQNKITERERKKSFKQQQQQKYGESAFIRNAVRDFKARQFGFSVEKNNELK